MTALKVRTSRAPVPQAVAPVSAPPTPPRALLVSIYGLYARQSGGALGVSQLIELMDGLGVDEQAVRSLVSRLKQRGILQPERVRGAAGYGLSARARVLLDQGDRRIFSRPRAQLSDGWLLAVFSIPEAERAKRHTLRSRLTWLGFGTVSAGVWIAPGHLVAETVDVLEHYQLTSYVDLFRRAELAGDLRLRVRTWWDLAALSGLYSKFLAAYRPMLQDCRRRQPAGAAAFADYVSVVTAWRHLPYLDPGLPAEVLPARWPGARAEELFGSLQEVLIEPAQRHVLSVLG